MAEKTTARVKKGVAYYEGESFTLSNIDKVKVLDFSGYAHKDSLTYSRNNNDLIVSYYGANVTIKDYFGANGTVASTVKTIRTYDNSTKKRYKDYNLVTSGFLNHIESGVEDFAIKKGVITGTPFADTISAQSFNTPTGKKKDMGITIKTGFGNDNITGSNYKDTFNITGSGTKTINIGADDGDDTIKGINTNGVSLNLNISNTVSKYERTGNDLKITANKDDSYTTTTIKDYFKNSTIAPDVRLNGSYMLSNLNYTDLVNIDKSTQTKGQTIKGTFLNDKITGSNKADKITTGYGIDTITGGKGNDKITIDGAGSKYVIMNKGDGVDTVTSKVNDYIYLQFTGANITNESTARSYLKYEKSGKDDLKITSTTIKSAEITPTGYISNTGIDTDKLSFYYSCASGSYYTQITEDTGLYSYETDGETRYTTEKNATVKLNTTKLIQSRNSNTGIVDSVGYITDSSDYSASTDYYTVTSLSDENITNLYAYKSKTYSGIYEYVYSTNNNVAIKYSDLWLKKPYSNSSYYVFTTTKENDDCIQVSTLDKIYHWYDTVKLESTSDTYEEITKDKFDSTYYIDSNHQYVVDIDNNKNTPIYKTFDVSDSYYLELPDGPYSYNNYKGIAVSTALDETSYTKIEKIYITADDEGNYTYSTVKPKGFKEETDSTSVIIKDYLTKTQSVLITNSNSTSSARFLSDILNYMGLNIGNADSKKAQTLTGSNLRDNITGGSGKDKITTGNGSDIIKAGKGNDTITIDGNGNKTINIANTDGNDTIIFTDNNKKTSYDYNENKRTYLNFGDDATITYDIKGKDLIIKRAYTANGKQASASTTLKNYFNVSYKNQLATNIYVNGTKFIADDYFDNSAIDKSAGRKAQKINGNMFDNIITGGSANDTINGCGGNDVIDGINGSDTYVVNYNSGSKYYLYDTITINDSGDGAKDVDTLKLDIKKKDLGLLFNLNKITDSALYTDNDIIVGANHYQMNNQLMIAPDFDSLEDIENEELASGKVVLEHGIFADGLEKITTSDKKTITMNNIKAIAQDVASWLSTEGYDSTAAVYKSENENALITMLAKYNPDNASIKQYINAG